MDLYKKISRRYGKYLFVCMGFLAMNFTELDAREEKEGRSPSNLLFDEKYHPKLKLVELLTVVGMPLDQSKGSILQINEWAQEHLLRKNGERWQGDVNRFEALKPKIQPLLMDLGFTEEVAPHFKEYKGALLHGGLLSTVRFRLYYLGEQWKKGVRFSDLYFLSSERPLEPEKENKTALMEEGQAFLKRRKEWVAPLELPQTENQMTQFVWEQSEMPEEMRKEVKVHFINAPMKKNLKKEVIRPNTDDTIEEWLKTSPKEGSYLVISNAPYIIRQGLVIQSLTPSTYSFDTVGPAAGSQEKMAVFLDELARTIFQIKKDVPKN